MARGSWLKAHGSCLMAQGGIPRESSNINEPIVRESHGNHLTLQTVTSETSRLAWRALVVIAPDHYLCVVTRVVTRSLAPRPIIRGSSRGSLPDPYRVVTAPTQYWWVVTRVVTESLPGRCRPDPLFVGRYEGRYRSLRHTPFVVYKIKRRKGWGAWVLLRSCARVISIVVKMCFQTVHECGGVTLRITVCNCRLN